jgi:tetratricopeptide (TPR) repeat protein
MIGQWTVAKTKRVTLMSHKYKTAITEIICVLGVIASYHVIFAAEPGAGENDWTSDFAQGSTCYQNKETDKAIMAFKQALAAFVPEGASDQPTETEAMLRSKFDDEKESAIARYKVGLLYESQGLLDEAAALFRDSLAIISTQGARYLGYKKGCKSCHYKEWKSWKGTKMAKAFEALKPGASVETKVKFNLDPKKDYTEDPNCLGCHTTGFGLPGGYVIPRGAKYKVREASKQTVGGTCEACHGPGSLYGPIHKDVDDKARPYKQEEFYAAGEYRVDERVCTKCHNQRNPTAGPDFHFEFKAHKDKDTHENFPLIYRVHAPSAPAPKDFQDKRGHP